MATLYTKTWIYRGMPIFLIFDPKHSVWVLIRMPNPGGFDMYPQSMFWVKIIENIKLFRMEFFFFFF